MIQWVPVVYITGKRNAAAFRSGFSSPRIRVVVDARIPLVYSKRIDVAYLATIRVRLWSSLPVDLREAVSHEPESTHWLWPRHDLGTLAKTRALSSQYREVWVLTNLDRDLDVSGGASALNTLLSRVSQQIRNAPPQLADRRPVRVGFFHQDLLSDTLGFERLGHALGRYLSQPS